MATIREQLLKIPVHGESAIKEHISQKKQDPNDLSIRNLDEETTSNVRDVLSGESFYFNRTLRGFKFWVKVLNSIPINE